MHFSKTFFARFRIALELFAAAGLIAFFLCGLRMSEDSFLSLLAQLESYGVAIAVAEVLASSALLFLLFRSIIRARSRSLWLGTIAFFFIALCANILDYWTTIACTPDLSLENNPVWNAGTKVFGLQLSLLGGLLAKLDLSLLAAGCFGFYLQHRKLVAQWFTPYTPPQTPHARATAFIAMLAYYFALMNLFCFYVAYINSLVTDMNALSQLPPLPAVIVVFIAALTALLAVLSRRASKNMNTLTLSPVDVF